MKNKILFRLILYFVASLIVFSLVIGIMFATLFSRHNIDLHKAELEKRAVNVANTISEMFEGGTNGEIRTGTGYGAYLRFIEDISMNEVWIVDRNLKPITCGQVCHMDILHKDLPDWAAETVLSAIEEQILLSEDIRHEEHLIITAKPIVLQDGSVLGAALLQSRVLDANELTRSGITLLVISMAVAVFISVFIAVILSSRFTNPLGKMKRAALRISGGDYAAKTGVTQLDEIGELAAVMDNMAAKLEASAKESIKLDRLRRDFVANISHELRTPITVIRGSLEALRDRVVIDAEKVAEYYTQMLSESVYLERLVSDLLDLAHLQNSDFAIEVQDVDLKDVLEDVIRGMRRIAEQKRINLAFKYEGEDFMTTGDYGRLRQMMIIILDNAIKFSSEGKAVDIALTKTEAIINVIIRDKGCGIHPDDLPYIFERFYKQRTEQNKTGTGLGLTIAKQIADRHEASVGIMSNHGEGTEFAFTFYSKR